MGAERLVADGVRVSRRRPRVRSQAHEWRGGSVRGWGHMWARGGGARWKKVHRSRACGAGNVPLSYELL